MRIKRFSDKAVAVFHGLNGSPSEDRIEYLESIGYKVIYPHIDFEKEWNLDKCKSLFKSQLELIKDVDLIIGLSLGGYLAFCLSGYLNKNVILINPSLDRDKTKLDIKKFNIIPKDNYGNIEVYLGENDVLIDKRITLNYLNDNSIDYDFKIISEMEHRTPIEYFKEIINKSKLT